MMVGLVVVVVVVATVVTYEKRVYNFTGKRKEAVQVQKPGAVWLKQNVDSSTLRTQRVDGIGEGAVTILQTASRTGTTLMVKGWRGEELLGILVLRLVG